MPKNAISVTLQGENLTWLRARARSGYARSVSDALDRLVTEARTGAVGRDVRSVVGSIDVDASDPLLLEADDVLRDLFVGSLGRPYAVKERPSTYRTRKGKARG